MLLILTGVIAAASSLAMWKQIAPDREISPPPGSPNAVEIESSTILGSSRLQATTIVAGTVVAVRSVTLQNEIPGTVQTVDLVPGQIVNTGDILVALDVSVEQAELSAMEAEAALAASVYARVQHLLGHGAASREELDEARADWDIAVARIARIKAIIDRKLIRAPFRARVGLSDVHAGQYLDEGTTLTTLLGISDDVYVDFAIAQEARFSLDVGTSVTIHAAAATEHGWAAEIVGIDSLVDPITQDVKARAKVLGTELLPGTTVQVSIPVGEPMDSPRVAERNDSSAASRAAL